MKNSVAKLIAGTLVLAAALIAGQHAAFAYDDVVTGLDSTIAYPGCPPLTFSWNAMFHHDTFVTTDLIEDGGGAHYAPTTAFSTGYYTVAAGREYPDATGGAADRVITYGAGNITQIRAPECPLDFDSNVKLAIGNLATAGIQLMSNGDTATDGTANAIDSLTGKELTVPATRLDDNGDGILIYKTYFDFDVVEGTDYYFDYNRDGTIDNSPLDEAPGGPNGRGVSDRPFVVLYETTDGAEISMCNPPKTNFDTDAGDDGSSPSMTDNFWVGNPYAPVDADYPGGPRGDDNELAGGTPEGDPNIWFTATDDGNDVYEPLLIGEIKNLYLLTVVNLFPASTSNMFMVTTGRLDVEFTDGRLYDWYDQRYEYGADNFSLIMNASMQFTLAQDALGSYQYIDNGTMVVREPVPEPATGLLLLGPLAGLAVRRRRRT